MKSWRIVWLSFIGLLLSGIASAQEGFHLVFVSTRDGQEEIYISDTTGANPRNLTQNRARDWHPDWSPDGSRIVFTSDRDGNQELYLMSNNGSEQTNLTNSRANENSPSWSPNGRFIAFASDRDGAPDLYMMELESLTVIRLTNDGAVKGAPAWSPNSEQIIYWADDDGVTQLYVVDAAGGEPHRITSDGPNNWPAWSPNTNLIAYENAANGTADIFVMNADGTNPTNITNTPANELRPAWSADGQQIVFTSDRDGSLDLYIMNADGSNVRRITNTPSDEHAAMWQPSPATIQVAEGGAVVNLHFARLPERAIGTQEQVLYGDGRVKLYAPNQTDLDTPFQVRLEVVFDQAILPTATPVLDTSAPTATPMTMQEQQFTQVYSIMGAELQGIDLGRFEVAPNPSDYVLRLDPNAINFWEWTLRPKSNDAFGKNYLSVNLYIPEIQADGTILKSIVNSAAFQIEVLAPGAPLNNESLRLFSVPQPAENPDFSIMFADDTSFLILTHNDSSISTVTIAPTGTAGVYSIAQMFNTVNAQGWTWSPGICLRAVREGTAPTLPLFCDSVNHFETIFSPFDIFWYDDRRNALRDLVVSYNGRAIPCSSEARRCDIGD